MLENIGIMILEIVSMWCIW